MDKIVSYIDKKINPMDSSEFPVGEGLILFPKDKYIGLSLKNSLLLIHTSKMYSFRLNYSNVNKLSTIFLRKYPYPIDFELLENYFKENNDNPYAIYYVYTLIHNEIPLKHLYQFPKLYYSKTKESYNENLLELIKLSEPGDFFYTYNRKSGLSRLIRNADFSMWSHTGLIGENKNFVEMATSGSSHDRKIIDLYDKPEIDIAIYRPLFPKAKRELLLESVMAKENSKYDWIEVVKIFINYKLGTKYLKTKTTLSENIHMVKLELIAYA